MHWSDWTTFMYANIITWANLYNIYVCTYLYICIMLSDDHTSVHFVFAKGAHCVWIYDLKSILLLRSLFSFFFWLFNLWVESSGFNGSIHPFSHPSIDCKSSLSAVMWSRLCLLSWSIPNDIVEWFLLF